MSIMAPVSAACGTWRYSRKEMPDGHRAEMRSRFWPVQPARISDARRRDPRPADHARRRRIARSHAERKRVVPDALRGRVARQRLLRKRHVEQRRRANVMIEKEPGRW